jgi:hypothetical protein
MTEEEGDAAHEAYESLCEEINELVAKRTEHLSKEADDYVRNTLNDTYRFWRN